MKFYKTYNTCKRYQGSAIPVTLDGERRWVSGSALSDQMWYWLERTRFRMIGTILDTHDRIFYFRKGSGLYALHTQLYGDDNPWPQYEIFTDASQATALFKQTVTRYQKDTKRWKEVK